jgi:hypothetical protein
MINGGLKKLVRSLVYAGLVGWAVLSVEIGRADATLPWERVVVIGASASAGFMITEPFGGTNTLKCRLQYYLDAAFLVPHEPVRNLATAMFFLNPEGLGEQQVEAAVKAKPTLVVGVDFLFWYCYGDDLNDDGRKALFERGLKLLEQFQCPVIVGDIPDASYATNSGIISAAQVPSPAVLKGANARLQQWVAVHTNVTLVPLTRLMRAINSHQSLECHGQVLPYDVATPMIQEDHLHPTSRGAAWLALEILDVFTAKAGPDRVKEIQWDDETVYLTGRGRSQGRTK